MIKTRTLNDDVINTLEKLIRYTEDCKILWNKGESDCVFNSIMYPSRDHNYVYTFIISYKPNDTHVPYADAFELIFAVMKDSPNKSSYELYSKYSISTDSVNQLIRYDVGELLEKLFNMVSSRCRNKGTYNMIRDFTHAFSNIDKFNDK